MPWPRRAPDLPAAHPRRPGEQIELDLGGGRIGRIRDLGSGGRPSGDGSAAGVESGLGRLSRSGVRRGQHLSPLAVLEQTFALLPTAGVHHHLLSSPQPAGGRFRLALSSLNAASAGPVSGPRSRRRSRAHARIPAVSPTSSSPLNYRLADWRPQVAHEVRDRKVDRLTVVTAHRERKLAVSDSSAARSTACTRWIYVLVDVGLGHVPEMPSAADDAHADFAARGSSGRGRGGVLHPKAGASRRVRPRPPRRALDRDGSASTGAPAHGRCRCWSVDRNRCSLAERAGRTRRDRLRPAQVDAARRPSHGSDEVRGAAAQHPSGRPLVAHRLSARPALARRRARAGDRHFGLATYPDEDTVPTACSRQRASRAGSLQLRLDTP